MSPILLLLLFLLSLLLLSQDIRQRKISIKWVVVEKGYQDGPRESINLRNN